MYGNGVGTGMAITQVHRRLTRRAQIQENIAFFAVALGATSTTTVGLLLASGTFRASGMTTSGFVWFFRRTCSPLIPQFRHSGI